MMSNGETRQCHPALGEEHPQKEKQNYHTMYRKVSAKKKTRTVNVESELSVNSGRCKMEKNSPVPHTITLTALT